MTAFNHLNRRAIKLIKKGLCGFLMGLLTSVSVMAQNVVTATDSLSLKPTALVANKAIQDASNWQCPAFFQQKMRKLHTKKMVELCSLVKNKTVLVVNTASNCGFTPQFEGLEALYQTYKAQDFVILGFPSDDFFQEEDDEKDTAEVCYQNYGVSFPMFSPIAVRGSDAHPLFDYLGEQTTSPKWNFYKYLISANGEKIKHFNSRVKPQSKELVGAIEQLLAK